MLTTMTDRLYYHDSFLYDFDAEIRSVSETPRPALILDRTAFYPTSGGQIHDIGWITVADPPGAKLRISEVADNKDGQVVHFLEAPVKDLQAGTRVHGEIDASRRKDHMQQHSAQHVLSAAFVRLFNMPTVSFHMSDDYCSIDLNTAALAAQQVVSAERLANEIILENRAVSIRFVTRDEAEKLGLRKLPPAEREQLRLIDIHDFDLTACGGTHVSQTGQIGCILLRKTEKVRQGYRVEFVAGQRAVAIARKDFERLAEAASLFSAQIYDVPQQVRKSLEEIKSLRKQREESQEELAAALAASLLSDTAASNGRKIIVHTFAGRDLNFLKLVAQRITRQSSSAVALLASESPQAALVFAQSSGQPYDMNALLKETLSKLGGRGGGSKDLAQGGVGKAEEIADALAVAKQKLDSP
jgi:alanyl-tRNA synthetase